MHPRSLRASRNPPAIDCDPVIDLPGTIEYTQDEDESQATDAQELAKIKAIKKARIEAAANAYLRGEQPFILTAGLRGPFDRSWKNPWSAASKKRKRSPVAHEDTVIERTRKLLRSTDELSVPTSWRAPPATPRGYAAIDDPFQRPALSSPREVTPQEKVQSWLRRGSQPVHGDVHPVPASPTTQKKQIGLGHPSGFQRQHTPTKQFIAISSQDIHAPLYQADTRVGDSFTTIVHNDNKPQNADNTHLRLQDALHDHGVNIDDEAIDLEPTNQHELLPTNRDVSRAEAAIRQIRRDSMLSSPKASRLPPGDSSVEYHTANLHEKEESTNSTHDDEILQAAVMVGNSVKLKAPEIVTDEQMQDYSHSRQEQSSDAGSNHETEGAADILIDAPAVSDTRSTNLPPSAQIQPELHVSASNISSGNMVFLPPPPSVGVRMSASEKIEQKADGLTTISDKDESGLCKEHMPALESASSILNTASLTRTTSTHNHRVEKPKRRRPRTIRENKDKQVVSMSGTLSPPPAESIKNALKVKKATKSILKNKSSGSLSSKSLFKLPSQIDTSRARLVSGQDGLIQGKVEDFDIEEALDDMGSFLSTWDVETGGLRA